MEEWIEQIQECRFSQPEKVIEICEKMYQDGIETKDIQKQGQALFYIADAYVTLNDLDQAINKLADALEFTKRENLDELSSRILNDIAICFFSQSDFVMALDRYFEALRYAEKSKSSLMQSYLYNNIVGIFLELGDNKNAIAYFEKSIKYKDELDDKLFSEARIRLNRGVCHFYQKHYELAREDYFYAREHLTKDEMEETYIYCNSLGAKVFDYFGEKEEALKLCLEVAQKAQDYCDLENFTSAIDIVNILKKYDRYDQVKKILDVMENVINQNKSIKKHLLFISEQISYYQYMGQKDKVSELYRSYYEYSQKYEKENRELQIMSLKNRMRLNQQLQEKNEIEYKNELLTSETLTDPLTGLANRNGLRNIENEFIAIAEKTGEPISLAIIDIDNFKSLNDTYGHALGDECIRQVAQQLKAIEQEKRKAVRFGGDEFFLIALGESQPEFEALLHTFQENVIMSCKEIEQGLLEKNVTVSIGAITKPYTQADSMELFIHKADEALYEIKRMTKSGCRFVQKEDT